MDDRDPFDPEARSRSRRRSCPAWRAPSTRAPRIRAPRPSGRRAAPPPPPGRGRASRASTACDRGTRRPRRPRGVPARRPARPGSSPRTGSRGSRGSASRAGSPAPPDTGGIIATSSPSGTAVPGSAYSPFRAKRIEDRPGASTGKRSASAAQTASTSAPSAISSATSRVPASSRWTANSRTRTRIGIVATRSPVSRATRRSAGRRRAGRIVAVKRGSARTAASNARRAAVLASPGSTGRLPDARPLHRTLSAAIRAPGREPPDERLEVGLVLGLERVDEDEVERPGELRMCRGSANASSAGALTTVIRSSAMPAWRHQPRARSVRSRSGSIVTIVPSAGWPSASHSVE